MGERASNGGRGVSDVVGYVLVFSLVVLVVGVVYTAGFGSLTNAQQSEQVTNAERAFDVLAQNVDDLVVRGAPGRDTELKLADATLTYGDPVKLSVSWVNETGTRVNYSESVRPLVYVADDGTRLVYADGAVVRQQSNGSVALRRPGVVFGDRTVVPIVDTRALGGESAAGSTRVLVRTDVAEREVVTVGTTDPRFNVTTERYEAWNETLSEDAATTCDVTGSGETRTVSCAFSADRVYVQVVRVDVHII